MNGAFPLSDDFLYWDPERVMEYLVPIPNEPGAEAPAGEAGKRGDED